MLTRLRRSIDGHRWAISISNILAAALFVAGSFGFFWPALYVVSVSLFVLGSLLFLLTAVAGALLEQRASALNGGRVR